jgi:hypothetical protein
MALHTSLPIYATGGRLLTLAIRIQVQLPRAVKRALGDKVTTHCIDMLNAMALANASMRPGDRSRHIEQVLEIQRALQVLLRVCFDEKFVSHKLWGEATQLMDSIGKQAGGWLKKTSNRAPAA